LRWSISALGLKLYASSVGISIKRAKSDEVFKKKYNYAIETHFDEKFSAKMRDGKLLLWRDAA
jgi:hypothetical protein